MRIVLIKLRLSAMFSWDIILRAHLRAVRNNELGRTGVLGAIGSNSVDNSVSPRYNSYFACNLLSGPMWEYWQQIIKFKAS